MLTEFEYCFHVMCFLLIVDIIPMVCRVMLLLLVRSASARKQKKGVRPEVILAEDPFTHNEDHEGHEGRGGEVAEVGEVGDVGEVVPRFPRRTSPQTARAAGEAGRVGVSIIKWRVVYACVYMFAAALKTKNDLDENASNHRTRTCVSLMKIIRTTEKPIHLRRP